MPPGQESSYDRKAMLEYATRPNTNEKANRRLSVFRPHTKLDLLQRADCVHSVHSVRSTVHTAKDKLCLGTLKRVHWKKQLLLKPCLISASARSCTGLDLVNGGPPGRPAVLESFEAGGWSSQAEATETGVARWKMLGEARWEMPSGRRLR
ncbi:hypothetical protein BJX76DRAFT_234862 [Aspergillus varians]